MRGAYVHLLHQFFFHCDTTVLASQGSGIDNFDHAVSQLPYVLIGAGISIIGFLVLGFVM